MRSACRLWSNRRPWRRRHSSNARSPAWPKGGWPMSWTSASVSAKSTFRPSADATWRATCATSMVWVRRLRKWSEARLVKTCVLPARRRNARDCTIRSRSRSKGLRPSPAGAGKARGDRASSSSPKTAQNRSVSGLVAFSITAGSVARLLRGTLANVGQLDARALQLVLHMRYVSGIGIRRKRGCVLRKRALPLVDSQLQLAVLLIYFAEMVEHCGIVVATAGDCLTQVVLGQNVLPGLEVRPAQRVEIRPVLRVRRDRLAQQFDGFRELYAAVWQHVAEVVLDEGVLRIDRQRAAELGFGLVGQLLPIVKPPAIEVEDDLVIGLGRQRFRPVQLRGRFFPVLGVDFHVRDGVEHVAVLGCAVQLLLAETDGVVQLAGIGELASVHELHIVVLRLALRHRCGSGRGCRVLVRVAIAVDLAFASAQDIIAAQLLRLLVGSDGFRRLSLLAIDDAKAIEEEPTVVGLRLTVFAIGMRRRGQQCLQVRDGFVVTA